MPPYSILTTTTNHHHLPPPSTTATCCRVFPPTLPSSTPSINFPIAKFSTTLTHSPYKKTNNLIICMAKERRVKMVAKQIQRELSDMLLTDQVLQYAILPEAALGADRYLSSITTISDVEISSDLQVVKVYVSVFGDERGKEVAMSGLKSKAKYVRGQLGKRMKLRLTPEIRFIEDESLERGSRVIAILDKIKGEKKTVENLVGDQNESTNSNEDDEDWEDDEPDDDIIYVK
ncbi:probable ribosome-binding factor A, chloroplastic [Rutidosis leptorrhynchoides]|uniref:probable ribosome-binding factor A, chloroplastic n=1 Tax=Rutidosis leptorrhynchoides TaxID=125765 RepID=UPI003A9A3F89